MRLARTLLTAAALGASATCWAQVPAPGGYADAELQQAGYSAPSVAPPDDVEGFVVGDESPYDVMPAQYRTGGPLPMGAPQGYMGPGMGYEGMGCSDGSCDGNCGGNGHGHGHHHNCCVCDLWSDVHSHRRWWARSEYLYWQIEGNRLPPLVTTSPLGTAQADAGVLGLPDTQILYGGERVNDKYTNGGRFDVGYWLIDGQFLGIEAYYMSLFEANETFSASSAFSDGVQPNDRILARPFFNMQTLLQDSSVIAFDQFDLNGQIVDLDGSVNVRTSSDVQSAGALIRQLLWIDFTGGYRVDLIGGYRFFRFNDSLRIDDNFTAVGAIPNDIRFDSTDEFLADNQFHGGEIGLDGQWFHGRWSFEALGKIGLGNNREQVRINGSTTTTSAGASVTTPGGLLALPSNIGEFTRNETAYLPEVNLNLRLDITCNLRATVGYSVLYMDRVVRSGDQVDLGINPTQIGGVLLGDARPAFSFVEDDLIIHGANAGLELRW